jgi:hypothetical protein
MRSAFSPSRSTGLMRTEIARAPPPAAGWWCCACGARVPGSAGVRASRVECEEECLRHCNARLARAAALVLAAAVSDTPRVGFTGKLKKGEGPLFVILKRTPDISGNTSLAPGMHTIGFAMESEALEGKTHRRKLEQKEWTGLLPIPSAWPMPASAPPPTASWFSTRGGREDWGAPHKRGIAERLVAELVRVLDGGKGRIREDAVAGAFYPESPGQLRARIDGFLHAAPVVAGRNTAGAHRCRCGVCYSGAAAAAAQPTPRFRDEWNGCPLRSGAGVCLTDLAGPFAVSAARWGFVG